MALKLSDILGSQVPVLHFENLRSSFFVDAKSYRNLTPEQKTAYKNHIFESLPNNGNRNVEEGLSDLKMTFDRMDSSQAVSSSNYNFARALQDDSAVNVVIIDDDFVQAPYSIEMSSSSAFRNLPDGISHIRNFLYHHEFFHSLYDRLDAGADHMAAVEMLVENPGSRDFLSLWLNSRIFDNISKTDYQHTARAADAVAEALALPESEIERLRKMNPVERRAHTLQRAMEFDERDYDISGDTLDPATRIITDLGTDLGLKGLRQSDGVMREYYDELDGVKRKLLLAAAEKLAASGQYSESSPEQELLKEFIVSMKTLFPEELAAAGGGPALVTATPAPAQRTAP